MIYGDDVDINGSQSRTAMNLASSYVSKSVAEVCILEITIPKCKNKYFRNARAISCENGLIHNTNLEFDT